MSDAKDVAAAEAYNARWEERLRNQFNGVPVERIRDRLYGIRVEDDPRQEHAASFVVICPEHGVVASDDTDSLGWLNMARAHEAKRLHIAIHQPRTAVPLSEHAQMCEAPDDDAFDSSAGSQRDGFVGDHDPTPDRGQEDPGQAGLERPVVDRSDEDSSEDGSGDAGAVQTAIGNLA